nr:hypothetical protein [Tanacetum cinerariifolium]
DKMVLGSGVGGDGKWFGVRRWRRFAGKQGVSFSGKKGEFVRDPAQRKTPLALPWERIPRLDSGVRIRICSGE